MRRQAIISDNRSNILQQIAGECFDVCVIGAGASGAGCALDASLRGLRTILLDSGDFAGETSTASTKLVHGGVRYLQQAVTKLDIGQLRVVKRALRERKLMLDNAPHLTRTLRLLVPCFSRYQTLYYSIGMKMYDRIAGSENLFASCSYSHDEALLTMPELNGERLVGAVAYADGQFDDARYALALIKTFVKSGGRAINYVKVSGFEKNEIGTLKAAMVEDLPTRQQSLVKARVFINATGPRSDSIVALANPDAPKRLALSKGVHLLLPMESSARQNALLIPQTEDGRVIFAIPWQDRLLVGTTDDEIGPDEELQVTRDEAQYLLRHVNRYFKRQWTIDEVVSAIVGVRPLVRVSGVQHTKKLIRDHEVQVDTGSGLVSILGGKWTTYRAMAEDTIDTVQRRLGLSPTPSETKRHRLIGSSGFSHTYWQTLVRRYHVGDATAKHLSMKYGTDADAVLELAEQNEEFLKPIVNGAPAIRAQIVYGIQQEMAFTIEDVLARRIGLQLFSWKLAIQAAPIVASYLADAHGWSHSEKQEATQRYVTRINRCLEVIGLPAEKTVV